MNWKNETNFTILERLQNFEEIVGLASMRASGVSRYIHIRAAISRINDSISHTEFLSVFFS